MASGWQGLKTVRLLAALFVIGARLAPASAQELPAPASGQIEGVVLTREERPVAGADVRLGRLEDGAEFETKTDGEGRFSFPNLAPGDYRLRVELEKFAEHSQAVSLGARQTVRLRVALAPLPVTETITVTATRSQAKLGDVPAHVVVLGRDDIAHTPSLALDDLLRQTPAFSLFRRTSSLAAHPTTGGVSLRGVGASGASRTLVLVDGLPHNDPFGNWVYWNKIPHSQIDSIELVEGGISDQYGSSAMAGVIHLTTRRPGARMLELEALGGSRGTASADLFAGHQIGRFAFTAGAHAFRTGGYKLVREELRGPVDTDATSEHRTAHWRAEYRATDRITLLQHGRVFDEGRENGTLLQENSTRESFFAGGARGLTSPGEWQAQLFARAQTFDSSFSSLAADRVSEALALLQTVPSRDAGATAVWAGRLGARHRFAAGADARWIRAQNDENVFLPSGAIVRDRFIRGQQRYYGISFQDLFTPAPRLVLGVAGRLDRWRNLDASRTEVLKTTGETTRLDFLAASDTALSPRASLLYRLTHALALRAAFYQGFRAPTLNELYRPFRVGNVQTLENEALRAERLTGAEAGFNHLVSGRIFWRATAFWNRVKDPISNVTLSATPTLITRQRQNLGRLDVRGIESELEYRVNARWNAQAAYLFNQATVESFPAQREIEGRFIPQVPRHRASLRLTYFHPRLARANLQARYESHRFDDDLNRLKLGSFWVADFAAFRTLGNRWEMFFAVENLFNRRYAVQASPVELQGAPRLMSAGLRFRLMGK